MPGVNRACLPTALTPVRSRRPWPFGLVAWLGKAAGLLLLIAAIE